MYGTAPLGTAEYGTQGVALPVLSVSTLAASQITGYSARLNGAITDLGFDELEVTERGFIMGTASDGGNPGTYGYFEHSETEGGYPVGAFSVDVDNEWIDPDATYYYRAYAINEDGIKYGAEISFTATEVPTVTTEPVVNIKAFNAVGVIDITDEGDHNVTRIGFVYDTESRPDPADEPNPTPEGSGYANYVEYPGDFNDQTYARVLSGLQPNTTYYVRAFAYNSGGYGFGDEVTFTTSYASPEILSVEPSGLIVGSIDTGITILGAHFREGAVVTVDGVECENVVVVDENTITCDAPVSAVAKESVLTVTNDDDRSDSVDFFYIALVPPTPQPSPVTATFSVQGVAYLT